MGPARLNVPIRAPHRTIDPAGAVTEAHTQESTLHDRTVESCVAAKIKTWRFPIPKGGGEVFVTYPFIFTPGG